MKITMPQSMSIEDFMISKYGEEGGLHLFFNLAPTDSPNTE